ncbi:MAG: molecular chaperone HtpG [Gammaproteobacteria bacterium]|jgi:molecular chaperone HtpG|nr:molecular chaperone HtpG [Gammaproteobacteria bacterium]MBQ0774625.1 molecular chaperone HtpG [Gammaproteobacteria bacterium]|tara:strand:- start:82654 stop:84588 length:1935 start_codon:yes stop_codon:yes gene_type:complete
MSATVQTEKREFQTEVKQLLHLMVHSLYSNKEIFLRELISNASDAADKLKYTALQDDNLYQGDSNLAIHIEADKEAGTLTIRDNGIGMNQEEVIANLGTIARSGTAEFLKNLSGDDKKDSSLIGQFGVGFYSAFIVADRVEVFTRKAGTDASAGVYWASTGDGEFDLGETELEQRGTRIVLHLRDDEKEFLDAWKVKGLVRKYSDHIAVPVLVKDEKTVPAEGDDAENKEPTTEITWDQANTATAIWTRSKGDISDEEYQEFYRHISHDFGPASTWSHNRVEGSLDYTSLLFVPEKAPFDMFNREQSHGLKLYVQRVFIMDEAEQFMPMYLRFIKGVIDSNDLSLNISREILQQDKTVSALKAALSKRALSMLDKLAKSDAEKYQSFWDNFGNVLKEGPAEDAKSSDAIAKLLRFATTHNDNAVQNVSLSDYVERMSAEQNEIYYIAADSHQNALGSPHLEIFRKKGIEVLLLSDRIDDWLMSHLNEFDGKPLRDIAKGELDLGKLEDETEKLQQKETDKAFEALTLKIAEVLKDDVESVRTTHRLTDSPACLVVQNHDMGAQMRRILEAAGQSLPDTKPVLEINPEHPLVQRLNSESNESRSADLISVIHEQARLAGGDALKDAAGYVRKINKLLLELSSTEK